MDSIHSANNQLTDERFRLLTVAYRLPGKNGDLASYRPVLNQVWIMPDVIPFLESFIRMHEYHHFDCASLQPAQIFPLMDFLCETDRSLGLFDDLIEPLYSVLIPIDAGISLAPRYFARSSMPRYGRIAEKIYKLAEKFAQSSFSSLERREALKGAARAIAYLLVHIVPSRPQQGFEILDKMARVKLSPGWKRGSEASVDLLWKIMRDVQQRKITSFFVALPTIDPHFLVGNALSLIDGIFNLAKNRGPDLIPIMPTLAQVLSLGGLTFLATIRLKRFKHHYQARISLVHRNVSQKRDYDSAVKRYSQTFVNSANQGIECDTLRFFLTCLKNARQYYDRIEPDRFSKCISKMMIEYEKYLQTVNKNANCETCGLVMNMNDLSRYRHAIQEKVRFLRYRLSEAAGEYERWLKSKGIETMKKVLTGEGFVFDMPIRVVQQYRYF